MTTLLYGNSTWMYVRSSYDKICDATVCHQNVPSLIEVSIPVVLKVGVGFVNGNGETKSVRPYGPVW